MSERIIEIEICTNDEWLAVHGGCPSADGTSLADADIAAKYFGAAEVALENEPSLRGAKIVCARDQRMMLHAWNGAHFSHRCGGVGTFAHLTPDQVAAMDRAHAAGVAAAEAIAEAHKSDE